MAREHEHWVLEMFGGLDVKTPRQLDQTLSELRVQLVQRDAQENRP